MRLEDDLQDFIMYYDPTNIKKAQRNLTSGNQSRKSLA